MDALPSTKYAKSGEGHLAYQVFGDGPIDLLVVGSWVHHVEAVWTVPDLARHYRRLAAIGRVIIFDRRGTGLSDPVPLDRLPDLETQRDDLCAVLDAAGSTQAAVIGFTDGGPLAMLFAASHPERCRALVLYNVSSRMIADVDYPWGIPEEALADLLRRQSESWSAADHDFMRVMAPSRGDDARFMEQLAKFARTAVSPGAVDHYFRQLVFTDVRDLLPTLGVSTLVLQRADGRLTRPEMGRYLAENIPGARYVEVPGTDHLSFTEHSDEAVDEIAEFLTGTRVAPDPDRRLATVLFTDIVGSTERAATLGDTRWRALLDEHDRIVREELERFGGTEIGSTGDGFLSTFDGPGRAIRSARAMADALNAIDLSIRAGVHTGEVEVRGAQIGGLAVHIGARVAAQSAGGEVLVSSTVKDLLAGSGLEFIDRGEYDLKGVPGTWRLYAAQV